MKLEPGYHVLVVMDHNPPRLNLIEALIKHGTDFSNQFITLMCWCPAIYWEHGGGTGTPEVADLESELTQADAKHQHTLEVANQVFARASQMLQNAGVPEANISTRISFEGDSLAEAVIHELETHSYSTVMVDKRHHDVVNRLTKRGIWNLLSRHMPEVTVWAVDMTDMQIEVLS